VTDRPGPAAEGERLQKVLAQAGIGSRRACEELIAEGRVSVNGQTAELGRRVRTEQDVVAVDGMVIGIREGLAYYLLNKPAGVVSTASDPQGRPTVVDLVPSEPRVYPVGRLDAESEGLLLLTNDGDLAHRLTHPSFGAEKEYLVTVRGELRPGELRALREGVQLEDGFTAPAKVSQVSPGVLRMTIHEGRNRQVRRMTDAVGHPVVRLVRTRIGPVRIGALEPGSYRELGVGEVRALEREASGRSRRLERRASRRANSPGSPGV
jgi:23S rRNA pseudouridine2605 synthase